MSNIIKLTQGEIKTREAITIEARSWLVRLDSDETRDAELNEFHEWLNRSPYHREAFRQVKSAWDDLDQLVNILDRPVTQSGIHEDIRAPGTFTVISGRLRLAVVAGLVLVAGVIAALSVYWDHAEVMQSKAHTAGYTTVIGETRSITLPDSSMVRMNTASEIEVHYTEGTRIIKLSKGEAWFDVYHDPDRPFIVYAGRLAVQAVGTAFSVYVKEGKVDLTVTSGRIEVTTFKEDVSTKSLLGPEVLDTAVYRVPVVAGQNMVLDDSIEDVNDKIELVQKMEPGQIEKRLSWRDGILMFDNDTLEEVIAEINRYSTIKIVISDPEIRDMRFGGYFQASDVTTILATLEQNYGIAVKQLNPDVINLYRLTPD